LFGDNLEFQRQHLNWQREENTHANDFCAHLKDENEVGQEEMVVCPQNYYPQLAAVKMERVSSEFTYNRPVGEFLPIIVSKAGRVPHRRFIIHPHWYPTCGYFHIAWPSDVASSLTSFLLYVERDPFSSFEVLTKSRIVVINPLHYSLASSSHYCLAPPARRLGLIPHPEVS